MQATTVEEREGVCVFQFDSDMTTNDGLVLLADEKDLQGIWKVDHSTCQITVDTSVAASHVETVFKRAGMVYKKIDLRR